MIKKSTQIDYLMDFARRDLKYREIKEIQQWDLTAGSEKQVEEAEYYRKMKEIILNDHERENGKLSYKKHRTK